LPITLEKLHNDDEVFGDDDLFKIMVSIISEILAAILASILIEIKGNIQFHY